MKVFHSISEMKAFSYKMRAEKKIIGFVPTMGYFHEGHLELIRKCRRENDVAVVSIFVNPIQFAPTEDFLQYPRDLEQDRKLAESEGTDVIFVPSIEEMYPQSFQTYVTVKEMENPACGFRRPGHFQGVATVVLKLFHIVLPHRAYFGLKDYQQFRIINQMVKDLNLDVEICFIHTKREKDGLAMSSRNIYLKPEEREKASQLYKALLFTRKTYESGVTDALLLKNEVVRHLNSVDGFSIEYVTVVDAENLQPLKEVKEGGVILAAIYLGTTRLIDNITLLPKK